MANIQTIAQCITVTKNWWRMMMERASVSSSSDMVFYTTCGILKDRIHQLKEVHVFLSEGNKVDSHIFVGDFQRIIYGTVQEI